MQHKMQGRNGSSNSCALVNESGAQAIRPHHGSTPYFKARCPHGLVESIMLQTLPWALLMEEPM